MIETKLSLWEWLPKQYSFSGRLDRCNMVYGYWRTHRYWCGYWISFLTPIQRCHSTKDNWFNLLLFNIVAVPLFSCVYSVFAMFWDCMHLTRCNFGLKWHQYVSTSNILPRCSWVMQVLYYILKWYVIEPIVSCFRSGSPAWAVQ